MGRARAATFVVIEEIDPGTSCIAVDKLLAVSNTADFASAFGIELPLDDGVCYDLSSADLRRLKQTYGISELSGGQRRGRLRSAIALDSLTYKSHTGRELSLLLQEKKPMAFFALRPGQRLSAICKQPFGTFVRRGRLVRGAFTLQMPNSSRVKFVAFARPQEAWRIDALKLIKRAGLRSGWSECLERLEGTLLGYTDAQNDEFIGTFFSAKGKRRVRAHTGAAVVLKGR